MMFWFILGGLVGVAIMCLLQINREDIIKDRNVELQDLINKKEKQLLNTSKSYKGIIDKQNRIINAMSIAMENNHCSIEDIVNETICNHKRCIGNATQCRDCIKYYFERKVK